jgi:hypothetical protein
MEGKALTAIPSHIQKNLATEVINIYMYLTQEFKNRAENLIGIQNSHGQHPCPF